MAKKKTHQRNLERARANREAQGGRRGGGRGATTGGGMERRQVFALVLVGLMVVATVGVALALRGDDDPGVAIDDTSAEVDPGAGEGDATEDPVADGSEADATGGDDDGTAPAEGGCDTSGAPEPTAQVYDDAPEMTIDPSATYTAAIETTCGTVEVELFAEGSPTAVNNFVFLAGEGYYEGVPFHRVIDGFMVQGGDPSGTGFGGEEGYPGYTFDDELAFTEQYVEDNGGYVTGTLAMANAGPDTNGSQFFIMDGDTPLPPQYVVFGRTTAGQDVVDRISQVPVDGDQAVDPVRIVSVEVTTS